MYLLGHVGIGLLVFSPVAAALSWSGEPLLAILGLVVAAALSTVPDVDEHLPIPHRGPTHTVWFVAAGTLLLAACGWLLGLLAGGSGTYALLFGVAAVLSLSSHVVADSVTPMGIRPFAPVSEFQYSFELVYSADERTNRSLFSLGIGVAALSQLLVVLLG